MLNGWWIKAGCEKSWAGLFGWYSFSSCLKAHLSGFMLTGGSLHRYPRNQQAIFAGTSLLPTYLGLSLAFVLPIFAHGVSAHAQLEDEDASVLMEVVLEMDGCSPTTPANICSLQH